MKTCPSCNRRYEDETMMFCLQDGSRLVPDHKDDQATWHLPQSPVTEATRVGTAPSTTASPQPTITARPEQFQAKPRQVAHSQAYPEERSRHSALPWVLAIIFVLGASGVLIAWIVTRGRGTESRISNVPTPTPRSIAASLASPEVIDSPKPSESRSATNQALKNEKPQKPTPAPTPERAKPAFTLMNNISFSGGSRITYYPRASVGQCKADCAANASCRAFTWIRPGAYNPGDSAMCYLMASVTGPVSHPCCISAVKN